MSKFVKVRGLLIDSFAGAGGASLGIKWATGRSPDIAINHNLAAIQMHEANHPETLHLHDNVWAADMDDIIAGRPVGLLWASPDCRDFSRAKGDVPVKNEIRGLATVITKWAREFKPRVIILENVREFQEWGPLCPKWVCRACRWKGVEGQTILNRTRRRCPRCDSLKINQVEGLFPDPERRGQTFNRWIGRLKSLGYEVQYKELNGADYGAPTNRRRLFVVARCDGYEIKWPEPTHATPNKVRPPLQRHRTAAECIDWSIPCPSIFERDPPLVDKTMRRIAMGIKRYVLDAEKPFIVVVNHGGDHFRGGPLDGVLPTITKSNSFGVVVPEVAPLIIDIERSASEFRGRSIDQPMSTITAQPKGGKHALVAAFMAQHNGGMVGNPMDKPVATITQRGTQTQLVAAHLVHANHGDKQWSGMEDPMRTITSSNHAYLISAFLMKYYGAGIAKHIAQPIDTITSKDRFGVVVVYIGEYPYVITDIGMRMLHPRELAIAQGFPKDYVLLGSKVNQVARIGNSVVPQVAEALVRANFCPKLKKSKTLTYGRKLRS